MLSASAYGAPCGLELVGRIELAQPSQKIHVVLERDREHGTGPGRQAPLDPARGKNRMLWQGSGYRFLRCAQ
jgi:hypothetical protein